jgi:aryl-alcohol dehydrogenase-like predicted oxidoreductase
MEYLYLGKKDLKVSRLIFGCEQLGGIDWGRVDSEKLTDSVLRAFELGVNTFDVADVYGLGAAEELLSRTLGYRRHDVNIITKCGVNWQPSLSGQRAKTFFDSSPKYIVKALDNSLRRLRLESIPIYLVHWPDPNTPIMDSVDTLLKCQAEGKIQHIGVSNFSVQQLKSANLTSSISVAEFQYNLIRNQAEEDLFPCCREDKIVPFAYGALAQGFLTGKYKHNIEFGLDDRRHRLSHFQREQEYIAGLRILDRLEEVAHCYGKAVSQVAIRWILDKQLSACTIFGAKSPDQVDANIGSIGWELSQDDLNYLSL